MRLLPALKAKARQPTAKRNGLAGAGGVDFVIIESIMLYRIFLSTKWIEMFHSISIAQLSDI